MKKIAYRSSEQYSPGRFRQHGLTEMWFDGRLMRFESTGPFNQELIVAAGMGMRELLAEIPPPGPWAELTLIHGSALISREVLDATRTLIEQLKRERLTSVALALVAGPEVDGARLMVPEYAAVQGDSGRPFKAFMQMAEAEEWVAAHLAAADQRRR